jgi:hypothetical protein
MRKNCAFKTYQYPVLEAAHCRQAKEETVMSSSCACLNSGGARAAKTGCSRLHVEQARVLFEFDHYGQFYPMRCEVRSGWNEPLS